MNKIDQYLILKTSSIQTTLEHINSLPLELTLFVIDEEKAIVGTITDGDIRRGLIHGCHMKDHVEKVMNTQYHFLYEKEIDLAAIRLMKEKSITFIPILNKKKQLVDILNLQHQQTILPLDAIIMAGGKGSRLMPLTKDTPKPLLQIGGKPIIEHNIDRLRKFGIKNLNISIRYLGQQLIDYFGNGANKNMSIDYVTEDVPLGTAGALTLIKDFHHDYLLMMNSDLLTNINYELMFEQLLEENGDLIVATIPYEVQIPYGVLETEDKKVVALKEKPTYTYYSNAGIYMFKRSLIDLIPKDEFFNATDFMETIIAQDKTILHYPIVGYWLDIGKPNDFKKAQEDIKHLNL